MLLCTLPGAEAAALGSLISGTGLDEAGRAAAGALAAKGAIILAGERLAEVPGALSAADRLARATGARLACVPRRAGERGAIEAGALPGLLPGGRLVASSQARAEMARAWGVAALPAEPGRDTGQILAAAEHDLDALLVGGVRPGRPARPGRRPDRPGGGPIRGQPGAAAERGHRPGRRGGAAGGRGGRGRHVPVNWEGRPGTFGPALQVPGIESDLHVLRRIATRWTCTSACPTRPRPAPNSARWGQRRSADQAETAYGAPIASVPETAVPRPGPGQAVLATWSQLLTPGGRRTVSRSWLDSPAVLARMSAATAAQAAVADGVGYRRH